MKIRYRLEQEAEEELMGLVVAVVAVILAV
jgi:hypothetical protein